MYILGDTLVLKAHATDVHNNNNVRKEPYLSIAVDAFHLLNYNCIISLLFWFHSLALTC